MSRSCRSSPFLILTQGRWPRITVGTVTEETVGYSGDGSARGRSPPYIGNRCVGRAKSQPQNSPAIHRRIAGLVRWNKPEIGTDDRHAMADLVACRRREI